MTTRSAVITIKDQDTPLATVSVIVAGNTNHNAFGGERFLINHPFYIDSKDPDFILYYRLIHQYRVGTYRPDDFAKFLKKLSKAEMGGVASLIGPADSVMVERFINYDNLWISWDMWLNGWDAILEQLKRTKTDSSPAEQQYIYRMLGFLKAMK